MTNDASHTPRVLVPFGQGTGEYMTIHDDERSESLDATEEHHPPLTGVMSATSSPSCKRVSTGT